MTETRAVYHAPPDGRGVAWLTTTQLAAIVYNELRGLMDDAANRMPPTAGHMDTDRLAALRTDLSMALACTYRLEDAIAQAEQCDARRGMLADIGPASWEGDR